MDIDDTVAPKSDQMNAEDLLSGPRTFTISEVRVTGGEQPVSIYFEEFPKGRPFKPSKTVRRILIAIWGKQSAAYAGRRLTLYRDPGVLWAGEAVGGIRVSHMSHMDATRSIALSESNKKRRPWVIQPLDAAAVTAATVSAGTLAELDAMFVRKGIPDGARLSGVNALIGGQATALEVLTEDQAQHVLAVLAQKPDVEPEITAEDAFEGGGES